MYVVSLNVIRVTKAIRVIINTIDRNEFFFRLPVCMVTLITNNPLSLLSPLLGTECGRRLAPDKLQGHVAACLVNPFPLSVRLSEEEKQVFLVRRAASKQKVQKSWTGLSKKKHDLKGINNHNPYLKHNITMYVCIYIIM